MTELTGWLLDLYESQDGLALWVLTDGGSRLRLRQSFPVTFYVGGTPAELRTVWCFLRAQPLPVNLRRAERLDAFSGNPVVVLAVEVSRAGSQPATAALRSPR
jgi:hypothetical protein